MNQPSHSSGHHPDIARIDSGVRPGEYRWYYIAFGLRLRSDFVLDELPPAPPGPFDVAINRTPIQRKLRDVGKALHFDFETGEHLMEWREVGAFLIRGTDTIDVDPAEGRDERLLSFPLLGPVISMLLHLRGHLVMHASAISVGDNGVVLLGDKGAGKSTTAAALVAAGHRLLSDDVVALSFGEDGTPTVAPAFGQIKLSDEASESVDLESRVMRDTIHPAIAKRMHRIDRGFATAPLPARSFLVLGRSDRADIAQFPPGTAITELMRFSYVVRFGSAALSKAGAARHLRSCASAADTSFVGRFDVGSGLDRLPEAVALIEDHVRTISGGDAG